MLFASQARCERCRNLWNRTESLNQEDLCASQKNEIMNVHIVSPNALYSELRTHCTQNVVEAIASIAFEHPKSNVAFCSKPICVHASGYHSAAITSNAQTWACCTYQVFLNAGRTSFETLFHNWVPMPIRDRVSLYQPSIRALASIYNGAERL